MLFRLSISAWLQFACNLFTAYVNTFNFSPTSLSLSLGSCEVLACVASVSSRGSSRKLGQEGKNEWRGRGRGKKKPVAHKPHDFEKLRSPTNAASDWRGAGSVDYFAFETSIKPGMLCFRASHIWSHLICGRRLQMFWTDIYWNRVCAKFMRSESSKYNYRGLAEGWHRS